MQIITAHENYLLDRGITEQVATEVGLHWSEGKLVIPIRDPNGTFLFNKYRRSPDHSIGPKYMYDKGGKLALFGAEFITPEHETVYVCEGELDSLVIRSQINDSKVTAVSSTGGAGTWNSEWNYLLDGKRVIIIYDTDKPGVIGALKLSNKIPGSQVLYLTDNKAKDITEYYQQHKGNFIYMLRAQLNYIFLIPEHVNKKEKGILQDKWLQAVRESKNEVYWQNIILEYINSLPVPVPVKKKKVQGLEKNHNDLIAAKMRPCTDLLPFVQNKTKCLWHEEKDASLTYYPETNTCFCFGCRTRADSIDIYQKLHNCSLPVAIKALTNYA